MSTVADWFQDGIIFSLVHSQITNHVVASKLSEWPGGAPWDPDPKKFDGTHYRTTQRCTGVMDVQKHNPIRGNLRGQGHLERACGD